MSPVSGIEQSDLGADVAATRLLNLACKDEAMQVLVEAHMDHISQMRGRRVDVDPVHLGGQNVGNVDSPGDKAEMPVDHSPALTDGHFVSVDRAIHVDGRCLV